MAENTDEGTAGEAGPGMTSAQVDALLAELAEVATELIGDTATAEHELELRSEESERRIEQPEGPRNAPNPRRMLTDTRDGVADAVARELRTAARIVAAWWADVATCVVVAAVVRVPVRSARLAAADPTAFLDAEDLRLLPSPPESVRLLAGLAARMGPAPVHHDQGPGADLAASAQELASRAGLVVRGGPDGEPEVVDSLLPQAIRCRLWGALWCDHRLPELPTPEELADLLGTADVPEAVIKEIRQAAAAVAEVVAAELHLAEIDDAEPPRPYTENEEMLLELVGHGTEILARYARVLTAQLPAVRAATT